ncbi:MAG: 1-acyl-sn-glycerol-3-phosphate acyltransferase [Candidatus Binatia bacterium]|nr:1-acyl-sn-glycerol-3-phosphate acyltransferase [Candidatus Binatia bacterium]
MNAQPSAMVERLGWLPGRLSRWLTASVHLDRKEVENLRELAQTGTVVYVLRQRSLLDYLLINWLMLREGLPLARFANGVSAGWFAPFRDALRRVFGRFRPAKRHAAPDRDAAGELVEQGQPILIFLRARRPRLLGDARERLAAARPGADLLAEIVARSRRLDRSVHLVPVSLFRGRVIRRQASRISTLAYSVHDAPNDLKKIVTYAFNREDLILRVGRVVDLEEFVSANRPMGQARIARRLTHWLQRELAHEERAVWGPLIVPRESISERVFEGPEVSAAVTRIAAEKGISERKAWREARGYFWEMAANFSGLAFGISEGLFYQIWKRAFSGVEIRGIGRVADCVKQHPVVLVPCHRSHFDYMVLSYIFRQNFLSPPHIAAGINLKFWPMGPLLRGSGAFFMKRTFEDNALYKLVFHRYLSTLIRFGYTMEFFIEGGRSRTGKILTPKLGMLGGVVRAFLQGGRRDLYLVPISIHYGRIAEESAYDAELSGEAKQKENFGALLRARSVLTQRNGTVYVTFAEPRSMKALLGDRMQRFAEGEGDPEVEEEQRRFVQKLGFQILRDVNDVAVVGATSLSSTVLLSSPRGARGHEEFARFSQMLAELLRWKGVTFTSSLERNLASGSFAEITSFLTSAKLLEEGVRELRVPPGKRKVLDFYKNNSIHFFLLPSLVAHAMLRGVPRRDLSEEVWWWLDLFRWEFPLPEREEVAAEAGRLVDYLRAYGAGVDGASAHVPLVHALVGILENFREGYWITARTAAQIGEEPVSRAKFLQRLRRYFDAAMLLGEVVKPEAATDQTFGNAISRLVEIGCLEKETRRGEKDVWLRRGPNFDDLPDIANRIGAALVVARETTLQGEQKLARVAGEASRLSA